MKRTPCIALVAAVLLAASASAGPERGRHAPGGFVAAHAERLGLDETTRSEIETIARASLEQRHELRDELRAARKQLFTLLEAEQPDEAAVMAQSDEISRLQNAKRKHRLSTSLRIRGLLTPEQRSELSAIMAERREARERRRTERMAAIQTACAADLEQLCVDVPEGRARGRCLHEHREQLSDACRGVLRPMGRGRHGPRAGHRF